MNDQPAHCGEAAKITLRRGERGDDNGKGDRLAGFTGPAKGPATKGGPEAASRRKANSRSLAALGMTMVRDGRTGDDGGPETAGDAETQRKRSRCGRRRG